MICPKCNHQVVSFLRSFTLRRHSELTCPNCNSKLLIEKKPELLARIIMAFVVTIGIASASIYFRGQLPAILAISVGSAVLGQLVYVKLLKLYVVD